MHCSMLESTPVDNLLWIDADREQTERFDAVVITLRNATGSTSTLRPPLSSFCLYAHLAYETQTMLHAVQLAAIIGK